MRESGSFVLNVTIPSEIQETCEADDEETKIKHNEQHDGGHEGKHEARTSR